MKGDFIKEKRFGEVKAVEKRDLAVKEVIKPLLKDAGFKAKKLNWWKELEDGYLFVTMKNSLFNCQETGCSFCFLFSASYQGDICDKLENQWIHNQRESIEERLFLPHLGYLSPNRSRMEYWIDGYRNYQLADIPVEDILAQIRNDFEKYILPQIAQIRCVSDFVKLREQLREAVTTKENRLLAYYTLMQSLCCDENNLEHAMQIHKEHGFTAEEIRAHYDWLETITSNSAFPDMDAKVFIEKVLGN